MTKPVIFRVNKDLKIGGVQRRLRSVLPRLTDDFEVHVVTYRDKGAFWSELVEHNVHTHFVRLHGKWDPFGIYRLSRLFRQYQANVVHTHSLGGNISGILAAAMAGVPVCIGQVHNRDLHWYARSTLRRRKQIFQETLIHRLFTDKVLFVSQESLDYFQEKTRLPKKKLMLLHNGLDFKSMIPEFDPTKLMRNLGIATHKKVVGFVGRIVPEKNVHYYLDFAKKVLNYTDDYVFLVVGGGNEKMVSDLKAQVQGWNASKSIIFTGEQRQVYDFYNIFHCFFFSSEPQKEGMPGVVLEACAFGLPIISRRNRPVEEIAKYYSRILFIDKEIAPVRILNTAVSLPSADIEPLRREFDIETMVTRTKNLYFDLLQQKINRHYRHF